MVESVIDVKKASDQDLYGFMNSIMAELRERHHQLVEPPAVIVICDGGLVQDIISDLPVKFMVADYDIEGASPDEITNNLACLSFHTATPARELDTTLGETIKIFMKEVFNYEQPT